MPTKWRELTDTEAAVGEYLDRVLDGVRCADAGARLEALAPTLRMSAAAAGEVLRRWRYLHRVEERCGTGPAMACEAEVLEKVSDAQTVKAAPLEPQAGTGDPHGVEWLAPAAGLILGYLSKALLRKEVVWTYSQARMLGPGEAWEMRQGAGEVMTPRGAVDWLCCAVVIRRNGAVVDAYPEARFRRRLQRKGGVAIQMEVCRFREAINAPLLMRRLATMLRLYKGEASGLRSQCQVAILTDVSKQAINDMELRQAAFYRAQTGGRAGFQGVSGKGPKSKKQKS